MPDMDNYENLFQQVDRIIASQSGVDNYNVTKAFDSIRKSFDDFKDGYVILRRENQVLKIGVVGQVKAGKSSFLNSLFFNGESVLPKASTPMTAGLTVLEYGEESEFVVEYYNESEWQYFERNAKEYDECVMRYKDAHPNVKDEAVVKSANIPIELISANELVSNCADSAKAKITEESTTETKKFSGIRDLQEILEDFVGAKGKFTSVVKCLTIRLKDERLKDVCIVDTPGVNDPVVSRELRTRDFLRECHGVFFLSSASQFCNSSDVSFLSNRVESQGISKIVVIASRFDSVLQDLSVAKEFKDDLWGAVESCSCKLEGWFKSNVKNPDYIFDVSSGIGFSIAQKPEDEWDSMERNVVEQMKSLYPSSFSTPEALKESFLNLANLDEIRKEYLEEVFIKNRDSIIEKKTDGYVDQKRKEIHEVLAYQKQAVEENLNALMSADISRMKQTKKATKQVLEDIKGELESLANVCDDNVVEFRKKLENQFIESIEVCAPTKTVEKEFARKSTTMGWYRSVKAKCELVDGGKMAKEMNEKISDAANSLSKNWEENVKDLNDKLSSKVAELIKKAQDDDKSAYVDADGMRRILSECIASLTNEATFVYNDIVKEAKRRITDIGQDVTLVRELEEEEMSESVALERIGKIVVETNKNIRNKVCEAVDYFERGLKTKLAHSENTVKNLFKARKNDLIKKADTSIGKALEELEEELKDKERHAEIYKTAIAKIKEMEGLL